MRTILILALIVSLVLAGIVTYLVAGSKAEVVLGIGIGLLLLAPAGVLAYHHVQRKP